MMRYCQKAIAAEAGGAVQSFISSLRLGGTREPLLGGKGLIGHTLLSDLRQVKSQAGASQLIGIRSGDHRYSRTKGLRENRHIENAAVKDKTAVEVSTS
jgi:hypothetical protein